ncbi:TetR/AcrR family transcriptional regulator [Actinoplanes sp. NPDC051633]|uniref:TetR/AcrR family transcriptional regulator n=1 Tax=Actinoplanes sp. NPDC051633 TaxID=3155670 RepID=UPI00342CA925
MHEAKRRRVPAMAPEDRRAALVEACVPLLYEHGLEISTKQIAGAAGVAEGTIFGVFENKNALLVAALVRALDPQQTLDALAAIDRSLPLRDRLIITAELIQRRFTENARLIGAARTLAMAPENHENAAANMMRARTLLEAAITDVIAPDAESLRRSPQFTARLLLLFAGANTYGPFADPENFNAAELVSLLLDGLQVVERPDGLVLPRIGSWDDNENGDG